MSISAPYAPPKLLQPRLLLTPRRRLLSIPCSERREGCAARKGASHHGSAPGHATGAPTYRVTPANERYPDHPPALPGHSRC